MTRVLSSADHVLAGRCTKQRHQLLSGAFPTTADEAEVSTLFEAGGEARLPVIAMFTGIRTESALVEQLARLAEGARWTVAEVFPDAIESDDVFVGVEWRIRDGLVSSVMGLAPFASMPVTRRAPYVCIAAWPGEHDNPRWTKFENEIVHFLDTDLTNLKLFRSEVSSADEGKHRRDEGVAQRAA